VAVLSGEVPARTRRPSYAGQTDPYEDRTVTPLPIPVPPQLEQAVGYPGEARWLALSWTCCGDTVVYQDGRLVGTGHGFGFLGFARHPAVAPHLRDHGLGSSEQDAVELLVVDRVERRAYVADAVEARAFIREQWPAEPAVELTPEEWENVVEEVRQRMLSRPLPSMADLMRQLQEHSRLVGDMVKWLEKWQADQPPG
jgi:hypothetical protein